VENLCVQILITTKLISKAEQSSFSASIFTFVEKEGERVNSSTASGVSHDGHKTYQVWDEMWAVQLQEKEKSDSCPGNSGSGVLGD